MGGRPDGNRQDNRQRGNAAQLLEKYKNMARDSQLAGDRVQTEYYLQFADHYFRVLSESRSRFEDQRRPRDDEMDDEDEGEELEADGELSSDEDQQNEAPRADRGDRQDNRDRPRRRQAREERGDEPSEHRNGEERAERFERSGRAERSDRPRRNGSLGLNGNGDAGISLEVLPPAIGPIDAGSIPDVGGDEAEVERPRRRVRRPRAAGSDDEIAPAA